MLHLIDNIENQTPLFYWVHGLFHYSISTTTFPLRLFHYMWISTGLSLFSTPCSHELSCHMVNTNQSMNRHMNWQCIATVV